MFERFQYPFHTLISIYHLRERVLRLCSPLPSFSSLNPDIQRNQNEKEYHITHHLCMICLDAPCTRMFSRVLIFCDIKEESITWKIAIFGPELDGKHLSMHLRSLFVEKI